MNTHVQLYLHGRMRRQVELCSRKVKKKEKSNVPREKWSQMMENLIELN